MSLTHQQKKHDPSLSPDLGAREKQLSMSSAHVYQKCSSYLATNQKTMLESQTPEYNTLPICIYVHIYAQRDICSYFSIKE